MSLPSIPNTARVAISGTGPGGTIWSNVLHYRRVGGAITSADETALNTAIANLWNTILVSGGFALKTILPTTASMTKVSMYRLDTNLAMREFTHAITGTGTGGALPTETALVVTLRTELRGRRNRGRVYLGPVAQDHVTADGKAGTGTASQLVVQWNEHINLLAPINWELVIASYGSPSGTPPVYKWTPYATRVNHATVDTNFDSQRRRGLPR